MFVLLLLQVNKFFSCDFNFFIRVFNFGCLNLARIYFRGSLFQKREIEDPRNVVPIRYFTLFSLKRNYRENLIFFSHPSVFKKNKKKTKQKKR